MRHAADMLYHKNERAPINIAHSNLLHGHRAPTPRMGSMNVIWYASRIKRGVQIGFARRTTSMSITRTREDLRLSPGVACVDNPGNQVAEYQAPLPDGGGNQAGTRTR